MQFSRLAALLCLLLKEYGEVGPDEATSFQEECCGAGRLTAAMRSYGMQAGRRDVA